MTDHERCSARSCGRVHDLDTYLSPFHSEYFCALHRGKLEAGEGVTTRDGDTAYVRDGQLVVLPPKWEPRIPPPTGTQGAPHGTEEATHEH